MLQIHKKMILQIVLFNKNKKITIDTEEKHYF